MGHVIGHTAIGTVGSAAGGMRNRTHNTPLRQTLSVSASSRNSFNRTLNAGNRTKTKGRPRMSRAHSEVTCLFIISYAYSERTDLGFSLFLDRRCKIIYFIDNAEAFHNLVEVGPIY